MARQVHVTARTDGWAVKGNNALRASSLHQTKDQAVKAGIDSAKSKSAELFVHNRNGEIGYKNSYGKDPYPPRG